MEVQAKEATTGRHTSQPRSSWDAGSDLRSLCLDVVSPSSAETGKEAGRWRCIQKTAGLRKRERGSAGGRVTREWGRARANEGSIVNAEWMRENGTGRLTSGSP